MRQDNKSNKVDLYKRDSQGRMILCGHMMNAEQAIEAGYKPMHAEECD